MKAKVYRSGSVAAPAKRGVEADSYMNADKVKPAGRQGRMDGIFASPNLEGVARWAYSKSSIAFCADPFVRELTVDPDKVYVYSISAWEKASWNWNPGGYKAYWASGITLTEWLQNQESYDPTDWELLLGADDVQSVKPVSDKRLLKSCETSFNLHDELVWSLASARRALRWA
jgi:hypothetical protein